MSGSINKILLLGYVQDQPEFSADENKVAVLRFHLLTEELHRKSGKQFIQPELHRIVMRRAMAESAQMILKPGQLISLEGKIHTRTFEDRQGIIRHITEVIVGHFKFIGRPGDFNG